nr:MAG TPA: hypothetical protein [Myoviridae sp. ctTS62]
MIRKPKGSAVKQIYTSGVNLADLKSFHRLSIQQTRKLYDNFR